MGGRTLRKGRLLQSICVLRQHFSCRFSGSNPRQHFGFPVDHAAVYLDLTSGIFFTVAEAPEVAESSGPTLADRLKAQVR